MAISDNYEPVKEVGNGVTVTFTGDWAVLSASFLRVFLEDVTTGVQVPVDEGGAADEYTVAFTDSGFVVTFNTAPTSADFVVIAREVSENQTTPYHTSKGFQGSALENSLDKLTAIDQDQSDQIDRSPKFPLGSGLVGSLPTPTDELSLVWDGTTGAIKNGASSTDIENAAANAALTAADVITTNANVVTTNADVVLCDQAVTDAQAAAGGVKVSSNDTSPSNLEDKLLVGAGLSLSTQNDGGNETRTINQAFASQAEAEAGVATDKPLNSLRTKQAIDAAVSLPQLPRAYLRFDGSGANGSKTLLSSVNVASVSRTSLGAYTVTFTDDLPSTAYLAMYDGKRDGSAEATYMLRGTASVGTFAFTTVDNSAALRDSDEINLVFWDD